MDPLVYTIAETSRLLSIHRNTVNRLVKNGDLKTINVGMGEGSRGVRVTAQSISHYLRGKMPESEDFEVEVAHINDDYLIIQKTPGKQRILATCPYPKYADHVAEALREKGPLDG